MCQSVSEGGRRCPAHRHDSRAIIDHVQAQEGGGGGYTRSLYNAAFLDLRRTNRGAILNTSAESYSLDIVQRTIAESERPLDAHPADFVTLTSQTSLISTGVVDDASDAIIISSVRGESEEASRQAFSYVYDHVDNFPTPRPEVLAQATAMLESNDWGGRITRDPQAARALALFQSGYFHEVDPSLVTPPPVQERVSRIPTLMNMMSSNSPIVSAGFDPEVDGQTSRLELVLRDDLDTRLTYQNVTEAEWAVIQTGGPAAAHAIQSIRLNPECRYASAEEAATGGLTEDRNASERCQNCGQFTGGAPHACPAVRLRTDVYASASLPVPEDAFEPVHEDIAVSEDEEDEETEESEESSLDQPEVGYDLPQTLEEMATYPSAESILANMNYQRLDLGENIRPRTAGIHAILFCRLPTHLKGVLIATGNLPTDTDPNSMVIYLDNRFRYSPGDEDFIVLRVLPPSESVGVIISRGTVYTRTQGRMLATNQDWQDVYGDVPDDVTLITRNESASTDIAPVTSTASLLEIRPNANIDDTETYPELIVGDNSSRGTRDRWKFGRVREIKRGLEAGETILVPFDHTINYDYRANSFVDAQGWEVGIDKHRVGSSTTSGKVALRKNGQGVVEIVGVESLKCESCHKDNCSHIGYSVRQSAYIAQNMLAPSEATRTTVRARINRGPNPETGLPASFDSRCRVTRDESGLRTIRFNEVATNNRTSSLTRLAQPAEALGDDDLSIYSMVTYAPNPSLLTRGVRTLNEGEQMVVPLTAEFRGLAYSGLATATLPSVVRVTGDITYGREAGGSPVVRARNLRCTCDVYARNYSCRHTRRVEAGESGLMADPETQATIHRLAGPHPGLEPSQLRAAYTVAAVQDREAIFGRTVTIEEAEEIIDREQGLEMDESHALNAAYRQQIDEIRRAHQKRADLLVLAGYTEQREKMAARLADFQGPRYSEDYEAFEAEVAKVRAQIDAGEDPITTGFETTNALNGIGDDDDHARKFGVEIEVVFLPGDRHREKAAVARALKEAGLTERASVSGYHSGAANGWAKWTAENDSTVDLEVVSPLMKDTPEDWAQLQKVCDIIRQNGGRANIQTGSHVHISTGDYGRSVASHAALLDEFSRYADVLYRLGSDPKTKTHRGTRWCRPNVVNPGTEVSGVNMAGAAQISHYLSAHHSSAINFGASGKGAKSHAEIRIWDGSISPAHIQMQVMLTAAMTEKAAQRTAASREDDVFTYSPSDENMMLGTGKARRHSSKKADSAKFREMIDRYFPREADRKRFIALWETTKWQ